MSQLSTAAIVAVLLGTPMLAGQCRPHLISNRRYDHDFAHLIPDGHADAIGDVDRRRGPDFVLASGLTYGQGLQVFVNSGNGVLQRRSVPGDWATVGGASLGDIDRDGDFDVIVVRKTGLLPLFFVNDGFGGFMQETAGSRIRDSSGSTREVRAS